ncbi:MAG: PCP reductase family protein, partial [Rhodospirillaceae bacterium]
RRAGARAHHALRFVLVHDGDGKGAMQALRRVPAGVRRTVIRHTEAAAKEKGASEITAELYGEISRDAGMDDVVLDRFQRGG